MESQDGTVSEAIISSVLQEIKEMKGLVNNLLTLANTQLDRALIEMKIIRIDNMLGNFSQTDPRGSV